MQAPPPPPQRLTEESRREQTAQAAASRRVFGVAEQREDNNRLLDVTHHAIDALEEDIDGGTVTDDHVRRAGRIGIQLKRATDIDAALDKRGAPVGTADDEQGLVSDEEEIARLQETFEIVRGWREEAAEAGE